MPRPTPAQFAYGSVTVICSTFAMLLLSGTPSGPAVAVIAVVALVLGVLVALTAPGSAAARIRARTNTSSTVAPGQVSAPAAAGSTNSRHHTRHGAAAHGTAVRRARSAHRVAEPSLRH